MVACAVAAGCTDNARPAVSSESSDSISPSDRVIDTWREVDQGPDVPGLTMIANYGGENSGAMRSVQAVGPQGLVVATEFSIGDPNVDLLGNPRLWQVRDGLGSMTSAPDPTGTSQVLYAVTDGDQLLWRETHSSNLDEEDWLIVVSDADGDASVIADSATFYTTDSMPAYNPDRHALAMAGDRAYWSVTDWPKNWAPDAALAGLYDERRTHRILSRALDGTGEITEVAEGAYGPSSAGSRLLFIEDDRLRTGEGQGDTRVIQIEDGRRTVLATTPDAPTGSGYVMTCGTDEYTSWADFDPSGQGTITIRDIDSDDVQELSVDAKGQIELSCGDGFVSWGRGSGEGDAQLYLHDIAAEETHVLGETKGYGKTYAGGDTISWPGEMVGRTVEWSIATWEPTD